MKASLVFLTGGGSSIAAVDAIEGVPFCYQQRILRVETWFEDAGKNVDISRPGTWEECWNVL